MKIPKKLKILGFYRDWKLSFIKMEKVTNINWAKNCCSTSRTRELWNTGFPKCHVALILTANIIRWSLMKQVCTLDNSTTFKNQVFKKTQILSIPIFTKTKPNLQSICIFRQIANFIQDKRLFIRPFFLKGKRCLKRSWTPTWWVSLKTHSMYISIAKSGSCSHKQKVKLKSSMPNYFA